MYATFYSGHSDGVLFVLIEISENDKEVLFRNGRDKFDHIIEDKRRAFPDLWDFVLRCLSEKATK